MNRRASPAAIAALVCMVSAAQAEAPEPGAQYLIVRSYETSDESSAGSSGNSSGRDSTIERVLAVRDGGIELEYDFPAETSAQERASSWQFPVRVLRQPGRPTILLNREELEARVERWLAAAGWPREVCGRWIFTWNAFKIQCDPQSAVALVDELDLRSADLREGGVYRDPSARAPGALRRIAGAEGTRFAAVLEVDPDAVRRGRAESDVAVGEITGSRVTLEDALRARSRESVTGTIEVMFDVDSAGEAWRRTKVTRIRIVSPGGESETRTATETLERQPVRQPAARR